MIRARWRMGQILIRKVEPELKLALKYRAERNNRSLEAEVCEIIRIALDKEQEETEAYAMR
jgi:plasmid stability protein